MKMSINPENDVVIEAPTLVRDDDTDGTSFVLGENKMAWIRVEQHPGLGFDVKLAHTADGLHIDAYRLLEDEELELEGSILLTFD